MFDAGLVLEGGGMRGIYSAGVLEFFLEKGIRFANCYGVSAGSCHMCSYMSGQRQRSYRISVKYLKDKEYCSFYSLLKTGDLFGADFCYNKLPNVLDPYDYDGFNQYPGKGYAVVTNIRTGKAEYPELKDMHTDIEWIRASSSMPLVSRNVEKNGELYLDGGITDPIPIQKALADGNKKNIVVLTKENGYIREPFKHIGLLRLVYHKYPTVAESMKNRHTAYNETMRFIEEEEKKGNLFVIRPKENPRFGRVEKDKNKLRKLYWQGFRDAEACYEKMLDYLKQES